MKIQPTVGSFLAQGLAGGALGGFIFVFLSTLREGSSGFAATVYSTFFCMVVGSIIGVIEAACTWGLYNSGIQLRAATRVSVVSVVATLIVVLAGFQFKGVESALSYLLMMTLSFAVPPALLAGSNFRPSELFTFGTIAVRGVGFDELFESKSVWAIVGTLPLRFLSLVTAGLWLLYIAQAPKGNASSIEIAIVSALPLLYTGISAFLTFRSPGKLLLLLLGIGGNIPVVIGGLICFSLYTSFHGTTHLLVLSEICLAFLFSWTIFLMARLSVDTSKLMPLSILPDKALPSGSEEVV
jgi:hypothetical protein